MLIDNITEQILTTLYKINFKYVDCFSFKYGVSDAHSGANFGHEESEDGAGSRVCTTYYVGKSGKLGKSVKSGKSRQESGSRVGIGN